MSTPLPVSTLGSALGPFPETAPLAIQELPSTPPPAGTEGGAPPKGSLLGAMMPFLLIGVVLWLLIFAPEKRARKQRQEMLGALKKGDKVVLTSGLHGEVAELREDRVVIKAADSRFTYSRSAIHEVMGADADGD
ncbi:MAG: preprotein translocase subunit YajC [Planctomycetota bacterium]